MLDRANVEESAQGSGSSSMVVSNSYDLTPPKTFVHSTNLDIDEVASTYASSAANDRIFSCGTSSDINPFLFLGKCAQNLLTHEKRSIKKLNSVKRCTLK